MDRNSLSIATVGLLVFLATGCGARPSGQPAATPNTGLVGGIALVRDLSEVSGQKVIVATYVFRSAGVQPLGALVVFGSGETPSLDDYHFRIRLVDGMGTVLSEYGIWDPRKAIVEMQGLVEVPEAVHVVRLPFDARARQVRVVDRQDKVVAATDVGPIIREFCAKAIEDPDCTRAGG
jgi:hypothetical protein